MKQNTQKKKNESLPYDSYHKATKMSFRKISILAFDVDKYYGGIYIITNNYLFFRIERVNDDDNKDNEDEKSSYNDKYKICKWRVTHQATLRDVLPNGLPLGVYTIKYDSVTGRIIIADNYKIQALYV